MDGLPPAFQQRENLAPGNRIAQDMPDAWEQGYDYDHAYHWQYIPVHVRDDVAQEISQARNPHRPYQSAKNIIYFKFFIVHSRHACYYGGKRTDDRHETGEKNGFRAVYVEKFLGHNHVMPAEKKRFLAPKQRRSYLAAEIVSHSIADHRCRKTPGQKKWEIQESLRCKESCREKQGVSRQEKSDKQTRFGKNKSEYYEIPAGFQQLYKIEHEDNIIMNLPALQYARIINAKL